MFKDTATKKSNSTDDGPTFDVLNSFTTIRRESSDSINRDRAPVLNLQYSTVHTIKNTFSILLSTLR